LVVVDKPSGLPSVPAGGFLENTLLSLVRKSLPAATPMHRLGRGTSGLVVFALSASARSILQSAWRTHRVHKEYRALLAGELRAPWREDHPIGPIPHPTLGTITAASPNGRPSLTEFFPLQTVDQQTVAEVHLHTGRPHQIRIHAAVAGFPLVGDPLYGKGGTPIPGVRAFPSDLGYFLHAHRLRFQHPTTGVSLEIEAPPPAELLTN